MSRRDQRGRPQPQPPRGEFWLLVAMAVLIATMALLHLAVQRERAAGAGVLDFQLLSLQSPAEGTIQAMRAPRELR